MPNGDEHPRGVRHPQNVVILGSTGSIGRSALSVIAHDGGARLQVLGLAAQSSWETLVAQARTSRW